MLPYIITRCDISRLLYETYFWRVRAHDAAGNWSGWSTINTFTITLLKTPRNGDFTIDTTPPLRWAGVLGATRYWLQVSTVPDIDADPTPPINLDSLTGTVFSPLSPLGYGRYYWRMQVDLGGGYTGDWTPIWTFTVTPSVPVKPALESPANRSVTSATPDQLTWLPLPDGQTYTYQVQLTTRHLRQPAAGRTLGENARRTFPRRWLRTGASSGACGPLTTWAWPGSGAPPGGSNWRPCRLPF